MITAIGGALTAALIWAVYALSHGGNHSGSPITIQTQTPTLTAPSAPIETGSVVQARDVTKHRRFVGAKVPIDPNDRIQFRVRLHNTSGQDLNGVVVRPDFPFSQLFLPPTMTVLEENGNVENTLASSLFVSFDPSRAVGEATLDLKSYRLLDDQMRLIRKLPPDVFRNGSSSDDIKVGTIKTGETVYVEFSATVGKGDVSPGQIEGGTLLFAEPANSHGNSFSSTALVARSGERLLVDLRLHNTGYDPVLSPFVRIRVLPGTPSTFKRLIARITTPPSANGFGPVTSRPLIINFQGDRRGTLTYIPGSTTLIRCLDDTCTKRRTRPLPDGLLQGGITVTPKIGGARGAITHRVTLQALRFIRFSLRAETR